jgi:nucleoside-diphosphate-sugar epimerase
MALISLTSAAYCALVKGGGPGARKLEGLGITQGSVWASDGKAPFARAGGVGRHLPGTWLPTYVEGDGSNPSVLRQARISLATCWPHAPPLGIDAAVSVASAAIAEKPALMRVLVTGHLGYLGSVLAPMFQAEGHDVTGLDSGLFGDCTFGPPPASIPSLDVDVRDVGAEAFRGFDAVVHLAALSNDPLSNLNPECTYDINHRATVRLARLAKEAGVRRFLFSSSCSLYGTAGDDMLNETASFQPITPYGESKVFAERDVAALADDRFTPTFLRNATAYGVSPRLRADLVVNNLVGYAITTGEVLIMSDGSPWRPLVHIEDIARAFLAIARAPRERVHNQAFNVGRNEENYRVRELADMVREAVPGSVVRYAEGGGPDKRCYRVDCSKIRREVPEFQPSGSVRQGIAELVDAYRRTGLTAEEFLSSRYLRIKRVMELKESGALDSMLRRARPRDAAPVAGAPRS